MQCAQTKVDQCSACTFKQCKVNMIGPFTGVALNLRLTRRALSRFKFNFNSRLFLKMPRVPCLVSQVPAAVQSGTVAH